MSEIGSTDSSKSVKLRDDYTLSYTYFFDLDGTLITHHRGDESEIPKDLQTVLSGTVEKLQEIRNKGHKIIIITGRKESLKEFTIYQLEKFGIIYDQLILNVGAGPRILINDKKRNNTVTSAYSINLLRDSGIKHIEVE